MFAASLTALFFAATAICGRQSALVFGSGLANGLRLVFALLIFLLVAAVRGTWWDTPASLEFFLAGAIGFGFGGFCVFQSLARLGSSLTLLVVECVAAIGAALLGVYVLGESLLIGEWTGIGLVVLGIVLGLLPFARQDVEGREGGTITVGLLWASFGGMLQATSLVLSRQAFLDCARLGEQVELFAAAFERLFGGGVLAIALALVAGSIGPRLAAGPDRVCRSWKERFRRGLPWATANALLGPVLGVTCWLWAVSVVHPGIAQAIASTAPLIALPLGGRLLELRLPAGYVVGASVSVAGVAFLAALPILRSLL